LNHRWSDLAQSARAKLLAYGNSLPEAPIKAPSPTVVMTWPTDKKSYGVTTGKTYVQFSNPPPAALLPSSQHDNAIIPDSNSLESSKVCDFLVSEELDEISNTLISSSGEVGVGEVV